MKNDIECNVIKGLLPLYAEKLTSKESNNLILSHIQGCPECKKLEEQIKMSNDDLIRKEDCKMNEKILNDDRNLFKLLKKKLGMKANIAITITILLLLAIITINYLSVSTLKEININDITISAVNYSLEDLKNESFKFIASGDNSDDERGVIISLSDEEKSDDNEAYYEMKIPDNQIKFSMNDNTINEIKEVTTINTKSPYKIQDIKYRRGEDNILYVESYKTSLLNNKSKNLNYEAISLEMEKIDKIVYIAKDGTQKVMWESEK